jgi:hypothetical protein
MFGKWFGLRRQNKSRDRRRRTCFVPQLDLLEERSVPAIFKVNTTADTLHPGSLRWAITKANSSPAPNPIVQFDQSQLGPGDHNFMVTSPLPAIAPGVTIDGSTDANHIIINGQNAGLAASGLTIGDNVHLINLSIVDFGAAGILVHGHNDVITDCNSGTDFQLNPNKGNGTGIVVQQSGNVTIQKSGGGAVTGWITSNTSDGIYVLDSERVTVSSLSVVGNHRDGLRVVGGNAPAGQFVTSVQSNLFNGNGGNGISLFYSSHNDIGTEGQNRIGNEDSVLEHASAQGNHGDGILIESSAARAATNNLIYYNVIASNYGNGVELTGPLTSNNVLQDNFIGMALLHDPVDSGQTYATPWGNKLNGVLISNGASNNSVGGLGLCLNLDQPTHNGLGNVIDANVLSGVELTDPGTTLNYVEGNVIGTDPSGQFNSITETTGPFNGTVRFTGNGFNGVMVANGSTFNQIGGSGGTATVSGDGNLISGNMAAGVDLRGGGTSGNLLWGNLIGTDFSGHHPLGNLDGVIVQLGAAGNHVGSDGVGSGRSFGNVISGNQLMGVVVTDPGTTGNLIQSNMIGTNLDGTGAVGNGLDGVFIANGASNNFLGGANDIPLSDLPGNVISGNRHNGVEVPGAGTNSNFVFGNLIGPGSDGSSDIGNEMDGVLVTLGATGTSIGGPSPALGNTISGNSLSGVVITQGATQTIVQQNEIGTTFDGLFGLGNTHDGVDVQTGANHIENNLISANYGNGVVVNGSANLILGNGIGMDLTGMIPRGNHLDGIVLDVTSGPGDNFVLGNLISGNLGNGIEAFGPASAGNQIKANFIGTNVQGEPGNGANALDGILIENTTGYQIGGFAVGVGNLISGNGRSGVDIVGPGSTNLTVLGNKIGTDVNGQFPLGNGQNGVVIRDGASNNVIGGVVPGAGNLISGNGIDGVLISNIGGFGTPTTGNKIFGNKIGTNADGTGPLTNQTQQQGVQIVGADDNWVGGAEPGQGNLISGNLQDGVQISGAAGTTIQGNLIGTTFDGMHALANGRNGVELLQGTIDTTIGGLATSTTTPGNVISGNSVFGVVISDVGTSFNRVCGNFIGTTLGGGATLGNMSSGVVVEHGASANQIGASVPGGERMIIVGNVISGNGLDGVDLTDPGTNNNVVQGNSIGNYTPASGAPGNAHHGVWVLNGAQSNTIGGLAVGAGNVIADNGAAGVVIGFGPQDASAVSNAILSNSIYDNNGLCIDLGNLDQSPSPSGPGPNQFQSAPVLANAVYDGMNTRVTLSLQATPGAMFTIQIFASPSPDPSGSVEGQTLVMTMMETADASGNILVTISVPGNLTGQFITATATDSANNTSEFSNAVRVS